MGGGSNALGIFSGFFDDPVELIGVEAGGRGLKTGLHAARLASMDGSVGVAQGYKTYFLQNSDGQMKETHSVAAGLDYVGVSPILASLREEGRVRFEAATDHEVLDAMSLTIKKEGLIPALESAHAFAHAFKEVSDLSVNDIILINQSGRGDKDIFTIADAFADPKWQEHIQKKSLHHVKLSMANQRGSIYCNCICDVSIKIRRCTGGCRRPMYLPLFLSPARTKTPFSESRRLAYRHNLCACLYAACTQTGQIRILSNFSISSGSDAIPQTYEFPLSRESSNFTRTY